MGTVLLMKIVVTVAKIVNVVSIPVIISVIYYLFLSG